MIKLFEAKITEKDNMLTAVSKGMAEGALNGAVTLLGIAGVVYTFGKMMKAEEIEITIEDDENDKDNKSL